MTLRTFIATGRSLMGGRRAFVVSGFWSLALRLSGLASGFALGVVLARVLGPKEFGVYGLVTTLAALGMTLAQLGTPQLAVKELSVRSARHDWAGIKAIIRTFGIAVASAGAVLGAIALPAVLLAGAPGTIVLLVLQGVLLTLLMSYTSLLAAELRGLGALIKGQMMDIVVRPGLTFAIILALLLAGTRLNAPLALSIQNGVTLAAAAVSALWLWQALPREARAAPAAKSVPWIHVALPLGAVDVLRQFDGTYALIVVGWLASGVELGVFRVAVACAVLSAMPVTIFHILIAPTLSRLHGSGDRRAMQELLGWTSGTMVAIMVPITLGAWIIGRPLIALVFGHAYAGAWLPLFLLTLAQLVYACFGMGPILLAMCGGERRLIRIYLVAVGTAVVAAVPMTLAWGSTGAAAASTVSAALIGFLSRRYARQTLDLEITILALARRTAR